MKYKCVNKIFQVKIKVLRREEKNLQRYLLCPLSLLDEMTRRVTSLLDGRAGCSVCVCLGVWGGRFTDGKLCAGKLLTRSEGWEGCEGCPHSQRLLVSVGQIYHCGWFQGSIVTSASSEPGKDAQEHTALRTFHRCRWGEKQPQEQTVVNVVP